MQIKGKGVGVVIDTHPIVNDVDLVCRAGEMVALTGASGSGKTTLLNCLGLLQVPTTGSVLVDGTDTGGWKAARRRRFWRQHASFVLQDYGIIADESVAFNITMRAGILTRRVSGDQRRMHAALEQTGLIGRDHDLAAHLSGGEKQRLAVARAIYKNAQVIYADEPTASLDDGNRSRVIGLLNERAHQGCTVIIATHDPVLSGACDKRYVLDEPGDVDETRALATEAGNRS